MKLKIEKLVYEGYGLGFHEGKAVFVPLAAPGDLLNVRITKSRKCFDHAEIVEMIEAAPGRVEPVCPHFGVCGGCHLQHISYAHQILWKQLILEEQFGRCAGLKDPEVLPAVPSPVIWGYRNRIQVHRRGGRIGFLVRESSDIVDVEECPIASADLNRRLKEIRRKWPTKEARYEISDDPERGFSQINPFINRELRGLITEWVSKISPGSILELYAGSGNLTFVLAGQTNNIIAVEWDRRAVAAGRQEIEKRELGAKVSFVSSDVSKSFGRMEIRSLQGVDLLVADPPREGMERLVANHLVKMAPRNILYISCNPSTLSRDLKIFFKAGYSFVRSQPLDMFPQTYHIESMTLLSHSVIPRLSRGIYAVIPSGSSDHPPAMLRKTKRAGAGG